MMGRRLRTSSARKLLSVPTARILQRDEYEFYYGRAADGTVQWTSDATIATRTPTSRS